MKQMSYLVQRRSDKLSFGCLSSSLPNPAPTSPPPSSSLPLSPTTGSFFSFARLVISAAAAVVALPQDGDPGTLSSCIEFPIAAFVDDEVTGLHLPAEPAEAVVAAKLKGTWGLAVAGGELLEVWGTSLLGVSMISLVSAALVASTCGLKGTA